MNNKNYFPDPGIMGLSSDQVIKDVSNLVINAIGYQSSPECHGKGVVCEGSYLHFQGGGKYTRALLTAEVGHLLGLDYTQMLSLGAAVELLHNASLVHDDIHDKADTRRGRPSLRSSFGDDIAILAGDLMISAAYGVIAGSGLTHTQGRIIQFMHQTVADVIRGQAEDLQSRSGKVSLNEYVSIVTAKSGGLIRLAMQLPFIAAEFDTSTVSLAAEAANQLAVSYQIADDLMDIDEDAGKSQSTKNLNIYHLLRVQMGPEEAYHSARQMGLEHLAQSKFLCMSLPLRSGEPLIRHCLELEACLDTRLAA